MKLKYHIPISLYPLIKHIAPYIAIAILLLFIVQSASANLVVSQTISSGGTGANIALNSGQTFQTTMTTLAITSINAALSVDSGGWANVYFTLARNSSRGVILGTSSTVTITGTSQYWYNFNLGSVTVTPDEYYIKANIVNSSGNIIFWDICTGVCYQYGSFDVLGVNAVFQIFGQQVSPNGIDGYVFKTISGQQINIQNAVVTITNNLTTSSFSDVTDSTGFFQFNGLTPNTTYVLNVKKPDEYDDSGTVFVTTTSDTHIRNDVQLFPCTTAYNCGMYMQSVQFVVTDFSMGTRYPGVFVTVQKWDEVIPFTSGTTGTDGSISFLLLKTQQYTLHFTNVSLGIDITLSVTPIIPVIFVRTPLQLIDIYGNPGGFNINDVILTSVSTHVINSTTAYINVSYNDSLAQTSNLIFYLNTSTPSDPLNQTVLQSYNGGSASSLNYSFIVSDYSCVNYFIHIRSSHTTFGEYTKNYGVFFPGLCNASGLNPTLMYYFGIALLIFIGGMAGATSSTQVGGVVVFMGWVLQGFGWISGVNTVAGLTAGLTLATVFIAISMMNDRAKNEGVA
jgi:hypothetical protein